MSNLRSIAVPVAASVATLVVLVGFFAAGFFVRGWWDQRMAVPGPTPPASGERYVADVSADDDPFWGPPDALVTIVEFADFQCPFCRHHAMETLPKLKQEYGDKVRYVFRDFPITSLHPEAFKAAEAAQCAFVQGAFWPYHELLFERPASLPPDSLKQFAANLRLDTIAFRACLDAGTFTDEVQADLDAGIAYGVTGTPAFFVNGRAIEGAAALSVFQRVINEELAKQATGGN